MYIACLKCEMLMELYQQTEKTPRNYWVMTELFVMLHDGDVCESVRGQIEYRPDNSEPGINLLDKIGKK